MCIRDRLTVFQSLPVDGIVTVSAPQELVAMIVGKAVNLAHDMNVELLGLVENMAYFCLLYTSWARFFISEQLRTRASAPRLALPDTHRTQSGNCSS